MTAHLLSLYPSQLQAATQHPFLAQAGDGTLPSPLLCKWLVQDKYYQNSYIRFVARLLAKLDMSFNIEVERTRTMATQIGRTISALVAVLQALRDEIDFYDSVAQNNELELVPEGIGEAAQGYSTLFEQAAEKSQSIGCGMVVLWGTELVS